MKSTSFDGAQERQALIDCVASWEVADYVFHAFPDAPNLAGSTHAKVVFRWLYEYHALSDGHPYAEGALQRDWEAKGAELSTDTKESVKVFMAAVGSDWKARAPKAVSKAKEDTANYLKQAAAVSFADRMLKTATSGHLDGFESLVSGYKTPGKTDARPVNIFRDAAAIHGALTAQEDVLFRFPGAIGELLGPVIRGDFLAPLAREKMGKSWIVDFVAHVAAFQGCHVLIVDVEMVKDQKLRRIWRQIVGAPLQGGDFELPYFDVDGEIQHRKRFVKGVGTDLADMEKMMSAFRRVSNGGSLEVINMPTRGCKVRDVERLVEAHIRETGKPYDLIIADSLDYFEPGKSSMDGIDKLFDIWSAFRGLGQKYPCAVMSPSHTGRKNKKGSGSEDDVAGNIQKLWMVTKTMYIEATKDEQENGVLRMSTSTSRDNRMRNDTVVVLQGLDIARPVLDSRWLSDVKGDRVFRGNTGDKWGKDLP